jgi:hypothetical protein
MDETRKVRIPTIVMHTFDFLKRGDIFIVGLGNKGVELDVGRHDRTFGFWTGSMSKGVLYIRPSS